MRHTLKREDKIERAALLAKDMKVGDIGEIVGDSEEASTVIACAYGPV